MKQLIFTLMLFASPALHGQWLAYTPSMPDTVGLWSIDAVDENVAWACAVKWNVSTGGYGFPGHDKGYFIKTADGGESWEAGLVPIGDVPYFSNICGLNADTAWASGVDNNTYESFVQHTRDGGQTWERQLADGFATPTSYVNFVHFWDARHGIAAGDAATDSLGADPYFEIYRTANGGQTWDRVQRDSILPADPLTGEFGNAAGYQVIGQNVWFSTSKGRLFWSGNGGQSWVSQVPAPAVFRFSFADSLWGIVFSGSNYRLTKDGGFTWTNVPPPPFSGNVVSLALIPGSRYILAVYLANPVNGPFRTVISKDFGASWQVIGNSENACVAEFVSPTVGYAGEWQPLNHATRMYRYNGAPLLGLLSGKPLAAKMTLSPNPAADLLRVDFEPAEPSEFVLLLNDLEGRLLARKTVERTARGAAQFDLTGLPPGVYSLTISGLQGSLSQKFVKH